MRARTGLLLLLACALPVASAAAKEAPAVPSAVDVVVRGKTTLVDALESAALPAWSGAEPRPVLVVVDVSPNTAKARGLLEEAFAELAPRARGVPEWSVAALGEKPGKPVASLGELTARLGQVLGKETDVPSTLTALAATLKSWKAKDGVVLYLADWRFEDDVDLERFVRDLTKKGRTLSVVGTEAAYGRAWNDGVRAGSERFVDSKAGFQLADYWPHVGRNPFGGKDDSAPWHGGDTAYPHAPYRWEQLLFHTSFSQSDWDFAALDEEIEDLADGLDPAKLPPLPDIPADKARRILEISMRLTEIELRLMDTEHPPSPEERAALEEEMRALTEELNRLSEDLPPGAPSVPEDAPDPEDLRRRLPGGGPPDPDDLADEDRHVKFPLPSSYGPYGLMRAAGVTGGRYVLWSWNPSGRKNVVLEYQRCNLFPPDLRPRDEILKDLRANPWAAAMQEAWWVLVESRLDLLEHTPPVQKSLRGPASVDRVEGAAWISWHWENKSEQKVFLRLVPRAIEACAAALEILDDAIEAAGEPDTPVQQRYHADALLMRHAVRCMHFSLSEALAAGRDVPPSAWKAKDDDPGVGMRGWVRQGRDPDEVRTWETTVPYDKDAGQVVLEERKALLRRFRGTPLGEILALNQIHTFRPTWWHETDDLPDTGRSPTESVDPPEPPKPAGPGGPSGGGGPTTGGG